MKNEKKHKINLVSVVAVGGLIIAVILTIGTISLGRIADRDTRVAVRNVSLLYLSELAERREQVVSSILNDYIRDLDVAVGMLGADDLSSTEALQNYQFRMKQLYELDKFAFIDTEGVIYTSQGTRSDIDQYSIDYLHLSEPAISTKNLYSNDKKLVIAIPVDNLVFLDHTLVVCFMEIDMDTLLRNVSVQSNNNTTFCNIYTPEGVALTEEVLGGLASESNLLEAMKRAVYDKGYSYEGVARDFQEGRRGEVSFSYNGINETLYYVPVHQTDWILTYLIRESTIGEQINSISESIIFRSVIQSALTAIMLIVLFSLLFLQQRKASRVALEREVTDAENRVRQQELEEQLAMQEELASKSDELAEALQAAEEANRAKTNFVSNMSHEIRTPITAILGMNEMIRRESGDENILSYADNIRNAGESLLGIISDILDFSKIEAGRMELDIREYSPMTLFQDLYNLVRFRAEAKGLNLEFHIDRTIPGSLIGDELRLKQVITNLLTNAVKYTERGDVRLDISCEERDPEGNRVRLNVSVSDTGIGIRAEEMSKLFEPFDRLDLSRTRSIEGTGLGLSISRRLLHMMDSELMVESIYEKGSRFSFSIWQEIHDAAEMGDFRPAALSQQAKQAPGKNYFTAPGRRILVVDDMPMNLQVMKGLLKRSEMIIDTASGGEECVRKFGEEDFDIVFMDYRMPGMNGIETLHKLKELYPEKAKRTPIISLTASAVLGDKERLLEEGFSDYLSKPVVISDLEEMMRRYLGDHRQEKPRDVSAEEAPRSEAAPLSSAPREASPEEVPQEILDIRELDPDRGRDYCGDVEDYLFALQTYAESVEEKAAALEKAQKEKNRDDYVLIVHSLKSMSRSIGALSLHEQAKALELAGKEGDLDALKQDTETFVREYRALGAKLNSARCLAELE